jgi:hypothetical protein
MEKSHLDALHNRVRNSQSATLAFATNALSEPLSRVHTLPPQLEHFQSWQGPNDQSIDQLTTASFWSCHLHFVVDTLIPNWSYAFEDGQRFQLLKATFVPYTRSKHATIMARQSLMILVDSLTQKTAPTGVLALSTRLLRLLMQEGGLDLLLGECYDAEWRSLVTAIVSIPARVANAIGQTSTHDDWYTDKYVVRLFNLLNVGFKPLSFHTHPNSIFTDYFVLCDQSIFSHYCQCHCSLR